MIRILIKLLASFVFLVWATSGLAEDEIKQLRYQPLEIEKSLFDKSGMLVKERDDYATNLARVAIEAAHVDQSDESLLQCRRLLALALQLSPRNRIAVVANHQLGRGVMPERKAADYSNSVFARLLLTRARLLKDGGTQADVLLAKYFIEVAAQLDPRNEEAVYQFEMQKLDEGLLDWDILMDGVP